MNVRMTPTTADVLSRVITPLDLISVIVVGDMSSI